MDNGSVDEKNDCVKKKECGQKKMSVLHVSVDCGLWTVDCGLWTVDYDSAISGEPPLQP